MNWLLIRGLGRVKEHWLDFPARLSHAGNQVLCLDLPGVGQEQSAAIPASIIKHKDILRENFMRGRRASNNSDKNWSILGISMGGMVALQWLHDHPEDFASGVIVNSSARDLSSFAQRISLFSIYCGLRASLTRNEYEYERSLIKMISNHKNADRDTIQKMVEISKISGVTYEKVMRQIWAASRFMAPEEISKPLLILASLKDQMVDVNCSKAMADRYKSAIKFHPTAGHDLPLDDPMWVAERIEEFVNSWPSFDSTEKLDANEKSNAVDTTEKIDLSTKAKR